LSNENLSKYLLQDVPAYKNVTEELEKVTRGLEKVKKKYIQLKRQDNTTDLWQAIKTYRQELMQQMINISKVQGPRGPPGYNGTQGPSPGPPGYNGTRGPPGDSGSGGLSLSSYKETKGPTASPSAYASSEVTANENNVGRQTLTQFGQRQNVPWSYQKR